MKLLMTCFKPFGGQSLNASYELLSRISNPYKNHPLYKLTLDVVYQEAGEAVIEEIKRIEPDLILLLGQAGGRSCLTLEYFALNMRSSAIKDNKGTVLELQEIEKDGASALKTTIPLEQIKDGLGDTLKLSYHAGTYVCNDVYYQVLSFIKKNRLEIPCAFVHIPYLEEQGKPHMKLDVGLETLTTLLDQLLEESYGTLSGN